LIYKERYGLELPEYPGITFASPKMQCEVILKEIMENWIEVEKPFEGAGVGMSQRARLHHVGFYLGADGGKVLHCTDPHGVCVNTVLQLRCQGYRIVRFFKHSLWPT
jgi:hypothetical protein